MRLPFFSSRKRPLPVVLQTEISECGLACLAMVASYHGHEMNLSGLRQHYPVSSRGANLKQLIDIADRLGLQSRPLKLEIQHVKDLQKPCILHWDLNHFVILASAKAGVYTIHDPAFGKRILNQQEFSKSFTGVALELQPKQNFQTLTMNMQLKISQLFEGVRGYKLSLIQVFVLSLMLLILTACIPLFLQLIMDDVLTSYDHQLLLLLVLGLVAVTFFQFTAGLMRGFLSLFIGNGLNYHASASVFQHLLRLPLAFFERRHMGDIMSRFHALEPLRKFLTEGLIEVILDGLMMLFMLGFMLVYSLQLSAVVLVSVFLYALLRLAFFPAFKRLTEEAIIAEAKQNSSFMETVRGIQSIKLYGGAPERHSQWLNLYTQQQNAQTSLGRFRVWFLVTKNGLYGLEKALILYLGVKLVFDAQLSAGMLIAFLSYKDQFSEKVTNLIEQALQYRMLSVHLDRLADIALHKTEAIPAMNLELPKPVLGAIDIEDLAYRFDADSPFLFRGLQLKIAAGESLAIVGPSGCGKTTLLKIMVGLLPPDEGKILIDGEDIRQQKSSFQKQIATVMQDDHLLSGSVIDNIAFFDPQPDLERVQACAKAAVIHDDILRMPMRYHSLMGEMGQSLSGGQKQRILLARALYRQPRILFMDEATSHLDQLTEQEINRNIRNLSITRVMIAHRFETILSADRVYRLAAGQLVPIEREEFLRHSASFRQDIS